MRSPSALEISGPERQPTRCGGGYRTLTRFRTTEDLGHEVIEARPPLDWAPFVDAILDIGGDG